MAKTGKMFKRIVAAVMIVTMLCGGAMAATHKANVITKSMKVYAKPSLSLEPIGSLKQGTAFKVLAVSDTGNWAKISYKGRTGYALMKNILFAKRVKAVVTKDTTMRFVTKVSYQNKQAFEAALLKGTPVYVVGHFKGELLVENADGDVLGVVNMKHVKKVA